MVKCLRRTIEQSPLLSCVVINLFFCGIIQLIPFICSLFSYSSITVFVFRFIDILYPIGLVFLFGFERMLLRKGFFKGLLCGPVIFLPQLFLLVVNIVSGLTAPETQWVSVFDIVSGILFVVGIAVREECFYRVIIQNLLFRKYAGTRSGIWKIVLISGGLFGITHAVNLFSGVAPLAVLFQVIVAVASGILFGAIYLRSGNIWVLILLHTLVNAVGLFDSIFLVGGDIVETMSEIGWCSLLGSFAFVLVTLFLLRKSKCQKIEII